MEDPALLTLPPSNRGGNRRLAYHRGNRCAAGDQERKFFGYVYHFSGLYGTHGGTVGNGVTGAGKGPTGAGVLGRNPNGPGVEGRESLYGGKFAGSPAQLMVVPKPAGTTGKPGGAHAKGEIYMDSAATLFVCTASGTPGTWRRVSTTAV